jgi:taurine dioxygenase
MHIQGFRLFGSQITGFQLAAASTTEAAVIRNAVVAHRVVVLRDQTSSDPDVVRFLAKLGDLMFTDGEVPVAGAPELNLVSTVGRTKPPRSVFHTDTSYVSRPPAFGALRAVVLPKAGGSTLFSDQIRAASALSARMCEWLRGRTLRHSVQDAAGVVREARHPLLRRQPGTGETALYLSTPERCSELSGVDAATSARIIEILYRRSIRVSNLYVHTWRPGDVVLWDNRTTMHRADHGSVSGDRILHRGLVMGEMPIGE